MKFVDEVEIILSSGHGGPGCVSFRKEAHVPRGGPEGGDGGKGGSLILRATRARNTLVDFRQNKAYRAPNGLPGLGKMMSGPQGEDLILDVPVGTQVYARDTDDLIVDLDEEGAEFVLLGGKGGLGNPHFRSASNRTPRFAQDGLPGKEIEVRLELKLVADVGLLGFPNAGKSTFIQTTTRSRSRIGAHPFTTINPQLGVVKLGDGSAFVIADMPGLIEGAADGAGLGHRFLKHVERCSFYLHFVAVDPYDEHSAVERFRKLNAELRAYSDKLMSRPQLVVLTKVDLIDGAELSAQIDELKEAAGVKVFPVSSVSGEGLDELLQAVWKLLQHLRSEASA